MTKEKLIKQVDKNRELINSLLNSNVSLDIMYFIIRKLAANNEKLLKTINEIK